MEVEQVRGACNSNLPRTDDSQSNQVADIDDMEVEQVQGARTSNLPRTDDSQSNQVADIDDMEVEQVQGARNSNLPRTDDSQSNQVVDIDEIFRQQGSYARFQVLVQLASVFLCITICWNFVLSVFTGDPAGWRCINGNSSIFCRQNINKSFTISDEDYYHRCTLRRTEWSFNVPTKYSFVTEFDLVCRKTPIAALVCSSYYIGGIIGSILSGPVADNFGRKPVLLASIITIFCLSMGGSFVRSIWQLFVTNMVVGAACVACYFTVFVYQMEFVSPACRAFSGTFIGLAMASSYLLIDGIAFYERQWRKLKMYTSLPCLLTLVIFAILPESPRWLLSVGNISMARQGIEKILKLNGNPSSDFQLKCPKVSKKGYTYMHLFRDKQLLVLTTCTAIMWFLQGLFFYSIVLGTPNIGGSFYGTYALSTLVDFPALSISPILANRFGRKKTYIICFTVAGILSGCMALVPISLAWKFYLNSVIMNVSRISSMIAFVTLYTWTFELYPTPLRSQGMSVCVVLERTGMSIVPFITKLLRQVSPKLPFIVICAFGLLAALIGLKLPETNKKATRETYEDVFEDQKTNKKDTRETYEDVFEDQKTNKKDTCETYENVHRELTV